MRILMLSLDKTILEEGSAAQARHFEYGNICESSDIVVLHEKQHEKENEITRNKQKNVRIYGVKGCNKIERLRDGYKKAKDIVKKEKINLITTQDAGFTGLIGFLFKRKYWGRLNVQIHGKGEKMLNKNLL